MNKNQRVAAILDRAVDRLSADPSLSIVAALNPPEGNPGHLEDFVMALKKAGLGNLPADKACGCEAVIGALRSASNALKPRLA